MARDVEEPSTNETNDVPQDVTDHIENLKRTYLYLRISFILVVVAIGLAIWFTSVDWFTSADYEPGNDKILRSISHYYYTPARIVFTGALCAAAVALLAITGKGVQSHWLDQAALLAPLIAIIPTRVLPSELGKDAVVGECVTGWADHFPKGFPGPDCIPEDLFSYVEVGFWVWFWLAVVGNLVALGMGLYRRRTKDDVSRSYWIMVGLGSATIIAYLYLWYSPGSTFAHEYLQIYGHIVAAGFFFVIIMIVAVIEARRQLKGPHPKKDPPLFTRKTYARIYLGTAVVLFVDIVVAIAAVGCKWGGFWVFGVEAVGLLTFAAFWITQTVEHVHDADGWNSPPPFSFAELRRTPKQSS